MAEAIKRQSGDVIDVTASAARTAAEVAQAPDGRAGVYPVAADSGARASLETEGVFRVLKTADIVMLAGQEIYWDHSAGTATYWATNDKDFYLGVVQKDAAGSDTTVDVKLNDRAACVFSAGAAGPEGAARTVVVLTAGTPSFLRSGSSHIGKFSLTAEAQKLDLLSLRSVPVASKWVWQGVGTVIADADADVGDLSFGMADGTHASDADTITTSAFFHINMSGADLKIYGESDNAAAEVAATDTTKVFAVGTPFHLMIDGRSGDGSGLKYYVNGIRVLSGTAFTVAGAAGPLKALFHLEKSANDSPGEVALDDMRLWLQDDAAAA